MMGDERRTGHRKKRLWHIKKAGGNRVPLEGPSTRMTALLVDMTEEKGGAFVVPDS